MNETNFSYDLAPTRRSRPEEAATPAPGWWQADDAECYPAAEQARKQSRHGRGSSVPWHVVWLALTVGSGVSIVVWLAEYFYYRTQSTVAARLISQTFANRARGSLVLTIVSVICYVGFLVATLKTWPREKAKNEVRAGAALSEAEDASQPS
jgi:Ca2+/H+ antiporter